ncbi:hypothetical protein [Jiangella alkaliphila]|uniref:Uncharacterized protein n=1 Tax=Jiangella alkaliphila TaxID=419479 RepID=A0A1H2GEJ0_9ACTN|nr:hypothetical protein [Jiangella alkaliphila]SDU17841.1 hypothetical protein SAMN04488563_0446 [Jiangella alkaliphila]
MIPHARDEIKMIAQHSRVVALDTAQGWNIQQWALDDDDIVRAVAAYQALLRVDLNEELDQLLADMGVDRLGPPATSDQHAKVMRADAIELVAAATVVAVDDVDIDDMHMPNVPKMAVQKSDSGIDIIAVELDPDASSDIGPGDRLVLVSVKHTVSRRAGGMRGKLEKSVTDELPAPYIHRQLTTVHGRLLQAGVNPNVAQRIFFFLRETLSNPRVRVVCIAAAAPTPHCNLADQPAQLAQTNMPDAHFRMLLVPNLATLHERLVPSG